jgi:hypothetical protein
MADDQPLLLDDHPIDNQSEDFLLGLEGRIEEGVPNAATERLQALQQPEFLLTLRALMVDLVEAGSKVAAMVFDPPPPFL